MIILRNYDRPEDDDFKLNVQDNLHETSEAVPIYNPDSGVLLGWKIIRRYE